MNKVLRFSYSGTDVDFYDDEVYRVAILTNRRNSIQRLANRKPIVYYLSDEYRTVNVDLDPALVTVIDNIETLRDITDIMTMFCYYSDGTTIAERIPVKIDRKAPSYFFGGDRKREIVRIRLYETSSGKVTFVDDEPIGT